MKNFEKADQFFISPNAQNHEAIRGIFDQTIETIIAHYGTSTQRNPLPYQGILDESIFDFTNEGETSTQIFEELKQVFQESQNHVSPHYIGHMDSMPTMMSMVAALSIAAVNNNMLGVEMSPVFTRMEKAVLNQFAQMFGYGEASGGVMGSGGSLSNLLAMVVARNKTLAIPHNDLSQLKSPPVAFASELAHASISKNAMILGLGTNNLIKIKVDDQGKMLVSDLETKIKESLAKGAKPFCVVATLGTTITGSIDPIQEIFQLTQQYGLWLHADAVYGGAAILSSQHRGILEGIENADSISFNPQKWMNVAKTCSMLLFRYFGDVQHYFRTAMPYTSSDDPDLINLSEIMIQGSRSTDILKLWLSIRHLGKKQYEKLIDWSFQLTHHFEQMIDDLEFVHKYAPSETNTILFRLDSQEQTEALQQIVLKEYGYYFSMQKVHEVRWLKFLPLNPYCTYDILERSVEAIKEAYQKIVSS